MLLWEENYKTTFKSVNCNAFEMKQKLINILKIIFIAFVTNTDVTN